MSAQQVKGGRRAAIKKALSWFSSLNRNERLLVTVTGAVLSLWLLSWPIGAIRNYVAQIAHETTLRGRDYTDLTRLLKRYNDLNLRLNELKASFDESQMTFEQVTAELDRIVQKSIGSTNYDLKKNRTPSELGLDFEKQDFTLNIQSLNLEQLINLLYEIEQGKSPLFMGKVDILQGTAEGTFRATLEIASISKKTAA